MGSAWMMQSLKREKQHKLGMGYQQFGDRHSPVRLRGVPIHGCHLKYICMQSEGSGRRVRGERRQGRNREMQRCCTRAPFDDADWADTHSVLQQLLGVVDCTDDSCSPAASTAVDADGDAVIRLVAANLADELQDGVNG